MEMCDEYQFKNSLNFFSITLGPFEKKPKEINETDLQEQMNEKKDKKGGSLFDDNEADELGFVKDAIKHD